MKNLIYIGLSAIAFSAIANISMADELEEVIVTSSLIHYCIEKEILFLLVVPRASIEYYTPNQKEWFDVMRKTNLVFYNDEKDKMGKMLIKLIDSKAEIPMELKKYHNKIFII